MRLKKALQAFMKAWKGEEEEKGDKPDSSHLLFLSFLQKEGRLIDFFKEDITSFSDAQIGAAVRKIHADCGKNLEELVGLRPIYVEKEGTKVTLPKGYDSQAIKVVGKVKGEPPYSGILRHKGWKAAKLTLPRDLTKKDPATVCPAEVEVI